MRDQITEAMERAGVLAITEAQPWSVSPSYLARKVYKAMEAARRPTCLCTPCTSRINRD